MIRLTLHYLLQPRKFLDLEHDWEEFDISHWSQDYRWREDDWSGLKDTVNEPTTTLTEYGDCDDYSAVVLSKLVATTDHTLYLVGLWSIRPFVGHVVVYDATEGLVYSSGDIIDKTLDQYIEDSIYSIVYQKKVQ